MGRGLVRGIGLVVVGCLGALGVARASETLNYQSLPYTVIVNTGNTSSLFPYSLGESITGSLTLATPLAPNLYRQAVTPSSFAFGDGVVAIDNLSPGADQSSFEFSTDSTGAITEWFTLASAVFLTSAGGDLVLDIRLAYLPGTQTFNLYDASIQILCAVQDPSCSLIGYTEAHSDENGQWTVGAVSDVPEPGAWMLMLLGLGAAGAGLRGGRRNVARG